MRGGDQFVATRLDRLARSVLHLSQITRDISAKNVDLVVLDQSIDTTSPTGRLHFHVLASIGEFERELIKERATEANKHRRRKLRLNRQRRAHRIMFRCVGPYDRCIRSDFALRPSKRDVSCITTRRDPHDRVDRAHPRRVE